MWKKRMFKILEGLTGLSDEEDVKKWIVERYGEYVPVGMYSLDESVDVYIHIEKDYSLRKIDIR